MTARLILHCDDFGLNSSVNEAVAAAADAGVLSSASLMMNGAAVNQAAEIARRYPALGVGVHLNILRGRPLAPASEVSSLLDGSGRFLNDGAALLRRAWLGLIEDEHIYREYRAQFEAALALGLTPTHLDGEKHTHLLLPGARRAVKRLCSEFNISKARTIRERGLHRILQRAGVRVRGSFRQNAKLLLLESASSKAAALWQGVKTPDFFFGTAVSGRLGRENGLRFLEALLGLDEEISIEWMLHLGGAWVPDESFSAEFGSFFLTGSRVRETGFLLSQDVKKMLSSPAARLITYGDL